MGKLSTITLAAGLALTTPPCSAQSAQTAPMVGTPIVLPRPDFHFPGNVGRTYLFTGKIEKVTFDLK